jgi:hypothetical protein
MKLGQFDKYLKGIGCPFIKFANSQSIVNARNSSLIKALLLDGVPFGTLSVALLGQNILTTTARIGKQIISNCGFF